MQDSSLLIYFTTFYSIYILEVIYAHCVWRWVDKLHNVTPRFLSSQLRI